MTRARHRGFPGDRYTPHGYLDNPRHAWRLGRSGVVRTTGAIGFAWHLPSYPGPYGKRWVYTASLEIAPDDLTEELSCDHHTKELFRFRRGDWTVEMFLGDEAIVALVDGPPRWPVEARATYRRQLGVSGDWDFGLLARQDPDGPGHLAVYAEGTAFVLLADQPLAGAVWTSPDAGWPDRAQPIEKSIRQRFSLAEGRMTVVLARAESSQAALARARRALADAGRTRRRKLRADAAFWRGAPRLAGDWPEHWRRGLVYDLETLRTIVRPPLGVYRSRWDGMQIQVPRVVLAETALDMLLLSYADPDTAKEVVLGTFRDAIAPNVPCTREDGSVNMVAVDGQACGTSPAWCWPFWCLGLLYRRTADRDWLAELLPHAERFLDWWLARRRHGDGAPFYLCGWESGQDASPRFGSAERGGGGIEQIEPVDLDAALALSARLLAGWCAALGRDGARWRRTADDFAARTRRLWHRGWFHDRTADGPTVPRDPMQLAPLLAGVATAEQTAALRAYLTSAPGRGAGSPARGGGRRGDLPGHAGYSALEWPPVALTALESAMAAGAGDWAARAAAELLERVWRATDAPRHEPDRPLPGVAHEHWPPEGEWHTEGYGWGATTVLLFMRYLAGVHDDPESDELPIEPRLPAALMRPGARYQLLNLPWRGERLDLTYSVTEGGLAVEKSWSRR
ncbi:MAG TPA: hypothetical protein VG370_16775 [Chloroflexota bacterium]|nr:hypothetical protein [Chloroflexota bacterium]